MTRPNEVAEAKWDEIDLQERVWIIPADRMKKVENMPFLSAQK